MYKERGVVELLAPAKNYDCVVAAVDHGADAVYMGGAVFGARKEAANSAQEVARAVEYAHQYGVKVYAALNTLIYDHELEMAKRAANELIEAGVDALIVQDMALLRMGLEVEMHASTQMCNMTPEGVRFLHELGFSRVVLERNLSLVQMHEIANAVPEVELEVFVHGAICVGYSGRCYLSRSLSERSGNRGECSQPCRLSYDLIDGEGSEVMRGKHLLSVKDLNLSSRIGEMLDMGVNSFKIEGRLKDAGYVKNVVAYYRQLLDHEMAKREGFVRSSVGKTTVEFTPNPTKSFTRGESLYLACGQRFSSSDKVASFDSPKSKGELIGEVVEVLTSRRVVCRTEQELNNGDGLCSLSKRGLQGANVNGVERRGRGTVVITFSRDLNFRVGEQLYRNYDHKFEQSLESSRTKRTIAVEAEVQSDSQHIEVRYRDEQGVEASALIVQQFELANDHEKMSEVIRSQLSRCGETIFECADVDIEGWGGEFIPSALLSKLRREALAQLREERVAKARKGCGKEFVENREVQYLTDKLSAAVGVTNSVAREFYRDHGVAEIPQSMECYESFEGTKVLESSYCIRGEIGECLRRGSTLAEPLYMVRGKSRYRLEFDCKQCRMALIQL